MNMIPRIRQPRPDDKLGKHRAEIELLRAAGFSFDAIAKRFGVTHVAVWKRWHKWMNPPRPDLTAEQWNQLRDYMAAPLWDALHQAIQNAWPNKVRNPVGVGAPLGMADSTKDSEQPSRLASGQNSGRSNAR